MWRTIRTVLQLGQYNNWVLVRGVGRGGVIQTSQKAVVVARCGETLEERTKKFESVFVFPNSPIVFVCKRGIFIHFY